MQNQSNGSPHTGTPLGYCGATYRELIRTNMRLRTACDETEEKIRDLEARLNKLKQYKAPDPQVVTRFDLAVGLAWSVLLVGIGWFLRAMYG